MLRHKVHALGFNRASLRFIFAGGKGGSITILCNSLSRAKRAMIREIEQENPLFKNIPIYLSRHGLRVWERDRKEEF